MNKYLCVHTLGPNALTRQQVEQLADTMQHDPNVRGYRSFGNLSEGKVACIIEGNDQRSVSTWFQQHKIPVDWICPVEFEGERGTIRDTRSQPLGGGEYEQSGAMPHA